MIAGVDHVSREPARRFGVVVPLRALQPYRCPALTTGGGPASGWETAARACARPRSASARCQKAGLADRADFVLADVCNTNLPREAADFVWGEDAWCYVTDKPALSAEAVRLVRPGGLIAFTDWVEGDNPMTDQEAERYLKFMKFPNVLTTGEYSRLLEENHCRILIAEDTGRFAACVDLYLNMVGIQFMGDALRILDHNRALLEAVAGEMRFLRDLAHAGKIAQGLVVAQRQ